MENCSRPNYGTVVGSSSNLVQGLTTQVASRDMTPRSKDQRSRFKRNAAYPNKNCNNSVPDGPIKVILGC